MLVFLAVFMLGVMDATGFYKFQQWDSGVGVVSLLIIIGGTLFQAFASFSSTVVFTALAQLKPSLTLSRSNHYYEKELERGMEVVRGLKHNRAITLQELSMAGQGTFQQFLVDLLEANYSASEIRVLGNHKIYTMQQTASQPLEVINTLNASSPAFGMLGTLLGLIVMLKDFESTTGLASGMGLAMMTTLYGLFLAQFFWQPLGKKIVQKNRLAVRRHQVLLEAALLAVENKPDLYALDQLSAMIELK